MEVKVRKRVPELTGAERNNESLLTLVSLSGHHPQVQRNTNTWNERRFESCHLHKTEREDRSLTYWNTDTAIARVSRKEEEMSIPHRGCVSRWKIGSEATVVTA